MIIGLEWALGRSTWMFGEDLGRGSSAALSFTLLPSALITRPFSPLCRAIVSRDTAASMRSQLHNEYRRFTTSPPPQPGPVSMDCCPGDDQLPASFLSSGPIDSFLSREFVELRFPPVASRAGMRQSINLRNDERLARIASTFIASSRVASSLFPCSVWRFVSFQVAEVSLKQKRSNGPMESIVFLFWFSRGMYFNTRTSRVSS